MTYVAKDLLVRINEEMLEYDEQYGEGMTAEDGFGFAKRLIGPLYEASIEIVRLRRELAATKAELDLVRSGDERTWKKERIELINERNTLSSELLDVRAKLLAVRTAVYKAGDVAFEAADAAALAGQAPLVWSAAYKAGMVAYNAADAAYDEEAEVEAGFLAAIAATKKETP